MRSVFLTIALYVLLSIASVKAFVININGAHQNVSSGKLAERFFTDVYAQLDIIPEFVYYPSKRGLRMVNRGYLDAEASRFESIGSIYPNLIKVNQAVINLHVGLFCFNNKACKITENAAVVMLEGLESGASFCEAKQFNCRYESDIDAIVRLLESGIAAAFLSTTLSAKQVICHSGDNAISFSELPEFKQQTFHYVNRKHIELLPKLETAIRELRGKVPEFRKSLAIESALDYQCHKNVFIADATR